MNHASTFTPSGGIPLVVPQLEPIDDEISQPLVAPTVPAAKALRARPASKSGAPVTAQAGPSPAPVPELTHGSAEAHWPTRHPPSRYSLTLPAAPPPASQGASSEFNFRGHVALGAGFVALALVVLMWLFGTGLWWAYIPLAGFAIWSGIRGHNAANRALATNPRQARAGIAAGALALLGVAAFLVKFVVDSATITF